MRPMTDVDNKVRLFNALENLRTAFNELNEAWSHKSNADLMELPVIPDYPFHKDFAELALAVPDWVDGMIDEMKAADGGPCYLCCNRNCDRDCYFNVGHVCKYTDWHGDGGEIECEPAECGCQATIQNREAEHMFDCNCNRCHPYNCPACEDKGCPVCDPNFR